MKATNLYLPEDVIAFAQKASKAEFRSMSNWIAMIIRVEMAKEKRVKK